MKFNKKKRSEIIHYLLLYLCWTTARLRFVFVLFCFFVFQKGSYILVCETQLTETGMPCSCNNYNKTVIVLKLADCLWGGSLPKSELMYVNHASRCIKASWCKELIAS